MKLYRVKLRGMQNSPTGVAYGNSYVIAEDGNEAYLKVKSFIDKNDLGFSRDRELQSVELLADENQYNQVGTMIFL